MLEEIKSRLLWVRRRPKRSLAIVVIAMFVCLNILAYMHAHAMTHFVAGAERTPSPEQLSVVGKVQVLLGGVRVARPENARTPTEVGLPYTAHTFNSNDGTKLEAWYLPADDARGICLLFHGYAECKAGLMAEAREFHELGLDVLLVDFRGSGGSAGDVTTIGFREADDVAAAVEYTRDNISVGPMLLFGRSMGAAAILRAIDLYDFSPTGIIIESPFDRLLSTVENRFTAMGVPSFPCAELLVFWGGVQQGYSGFTHNPVDFSRSVHCRSLVINGGRDPRATPDQVQAVFESLAGPKDLMTFERLGHESYFAAAPGRWRDGISGFVDQVFSSPQ